MDPTSRRSGLHGRPHPGLRHDLLTDIQGAPDIVQDRLIRPRVLLRYIPDRLVLEPEAFASYLSGLGRWAWEGPEELALAVLEDVNNEIVPRWIHVRVDCPGAGPVTHRVTVEDRQPGWAWSGLAPIASGGFRADP